MNSQAATKQQEVTKVQTNEMIPTKKQSEGEEIETLKSLVASLMHDPPKSRPELEARYTNIRESIRQIEDHRQRAHLIDNLLEIFDTDFQNARMVYSYLPQGFLNKEETSVFAEEYRFFVGGLKAYLATLQDPWDPSPPPSTDEKLL